MGFGREPHDFYHLSDVLSKSDALSKYSFHRAANHFSHKIPQCNTSSLVPLLIFICGIMDYGICPYL